MVLTVKNIMPLKSLAKRSLQHIAAQLGPQRIKSGRNRLLILMYHRVLPVNDERMHDEEPGMVVTPETFALHLQVLQQHFDIVHLADWLRRHEQGSALPQRACVITFDDGWLDNYQFAFPLLKQYQLPATIFLVSDMVGTKRNFWPERLAELLRITATQHSELWDTPAYRWLRDVDTNYDFGHKPPTHHQLFEIFNQAKRYSDEELHMRIDEMLSSSQKLPASSAAVLSWEQVAEMSDSGLLEFGSHTCDHIRLNDTVKQDIIKHQIIASKTTISEATNKTVNTFCYPNGDFNSSALEIVRKYYAGAVTTNNGWNSLKSDVHVLNRVGIHEDISTNETAFLARLSGWM